MKKIFTLLFAVGFLAVAANAQQGSRDNRDNPQYNQKNTPQSGQWDKNNGYSNEKDFNGTDDRYSKNSNSYGRGLEMQVAQINRKYDLQVQRVRNNFFMRRSEKTRMIRSLEVQRQQEIRMLYARSGNNRNQQDYRGYGSTRHY